MRTKRIKKAVSLLLAGAMVVIPFAGYGTMQAAKKGDKTKVKVSSVKIMNTGKTLRLQKGKKFILKTSVKVEPNESKYKKLKFTSSNRKVVLVNSRGLLKGLRVGNAKVTAASKTNPKKKASISVSVTKDVLVTDIKLNKTKITADEFNEEDIQLSVRKILPSNAKNKKVEWSSSNQEVADVSEDGLVTTGNVGTATITAAAADKGGAYATCRVTVMENSDQGDDTDVTEKPAEVTGEPVKQATEQPAHETEEPTWKPTEQPADETEEPTAKPTEEPADETEEPTAKPTEEPEVVTEKPTAEPTEEPVVVTEKPTTESGSVIQAPARTRKLSLTNDNVNGQIGLEDEYGNRNTGVRGRENGDGSMSFDTSALYSGGGISFYLNEDKSPLDLSQYSKVIVTVSSPQDNTDMVVLLQTDEPLDGWSGIMFADGDRFSCMYEANRKYQFVIDLARVAANPANEGMDAYGIFVKYNGYNKPSEDATDEERRAFRRTVTIHSIELIAKEGV